MDSDADQQLALGLERLTGLLHAQAWKRRGRSGLNPTQYAILAQLNGQRGGLRLKTLSEALGLTAPTLSDSVSALQRRGEVRRLPDPDDARAARIVITASGRRSLGRDRSQASAAQRLLEGLGQADRGTLLRLLQLLIHQAQFEGLASGFRTCLGCRFFQPYASENPERPHVCAYLGTDFGHMELRIDCAEQDPADSETVSTAALALREPLPP